MRTRTRSKIKIDKVIDEHSHRVSELFEKKSHHFRTLLTSFMGLAVVFFFFLFYPYVSLQGEKERIHVRQEKLGVEIDQLKKNIDAHLKAKEVFKKLVERTYVIREEMIDYDFHRNLEEESIKHEKYILSLKEDLKNEPEAKEWLNGQRQQPQFSDYFYHSHPHLLEGKKDLCFWLVGETWVKCNIGRKARAHHNNLLISFYPLNGEVATFINLNSVKNQLSNLQNSLEKWLSEDSPFWKKDRKIDDSDLRLGLSIFWHDYYTVLKNSSRMNKQKLTDLQKINMENGEKVKLLEKQKAKVDNRLNELKSFNEIQTPIGNLPVGLNDLILAFPVILAIGFLACTSLFCETIRLRNAFHNLYQKKDPTQTILTDSQVTLVAPLWIDPVDPEQNRSVKLTLLLAPFVIFVISISLTFYNGLLLGDFPSGASPSMVLLIILYVLSFAAFIYGFRRVLIGLRHYSDEWPESVYEPQDHEPIQSGETTSKHPNRG